MGGFKESKMWISCSKCTKRFEVTYFAKDTTTPISHITTNNQGSNGSGSSGNSNLKCYGDAIPIKDDVDVLSSVKISKFW